MQGNADRGRSPRGGIFSFVGRERELDLLVAALRRPPAVVLVEGEAGIGKSRLVREAAAVLRGAGGQVLTGYCHPLREPVPFGPVVDAFRKAGSLLPGLGAIPRSVGALAPLLPDLADRLPPPPPRTGDPQADRYQLAQGVRSFLSVLGPVVLVIEDLHWADEVTRELLLVLSRDMPEQLGLVVTFRGQDMRPGALSASALRRRPGAGGTMIHLAPLSERDVHDLVTSALGRGADASLGRAVYDRSEGLPLVAEEDLITLREHGVQGRAMGAAELERADVPQGLREAFMERFDALPPAGKAIVEAAAVIAVPATEDVLTEVAGLDDEEGHDGITEALRLAVLRESGPNLYAFRHVLALFVAHQNIPGPRRRRLHLKAIDVLEAQSSPPLVQIAHHTLQAGDREGWLRKAEEAATQAVALGDDGTAAALLQDLLDRPGLPERTRARAALDLSGIAARGADYTVNVAVLRRILADPQLPMAARGEIRLNLGVLIITHDADQAGIQEIEQAAAELAGNPDQVARAMTNLAQNERDGASDQTWAWMARAQRALGDSSSEATRCGVEATRLTLMARDGDPAVWEALDWMPRRASDINILRQTVRALYNVGELAIELGHDGRAKALLTESCELTKSGSLPIVEFYARIALLRLEVLAGDWNEVDERFGVLHRVYPDIAMAHLEQALMTGRVAAARGQHARALALFTTAAELGRGEPQVTNALRSAAALTALRLAEGAARDAWAIAAPAVAQLRRAAAWARATGLVPLAVEAAVTCGENDAAQRLVEDAEHGLTGRDAPAARAELDLARGIRLGASQDAATYFAQAHQLWLEIGRPYETAQAAEHLGSALAARNEHDAVTRLEEALAVYVRLNATRDAARCQRAMKDLGLASTPVPGRRGYGDELSPRERQVAELLAHGATNHEIAKALFLSQRTVELHVAHTLKKLGTSRKAVSDALEALQKAD